MADNPFLGVRLPPHIHQALLDRTAATGQNRSEIAIAALSAYLELPAENNDFTEVQQQLADVQQRLSAVESELSAVKQQQAIAPTADEAATDEIHCPRCKSSDRGIEGYATLKDGTRKVKLKCKSCQKMYRVPIE